MTQPDPTADGIRAALSHLDGSPESAVSLLTGVPVDQLDEYGGMGECERECWCRNPQVKPESA